MRDAASAAIIGGMQFLRLSLAVLTASAALPAADRMAGEWVCKLGSRTLLVLSLEQTPDTSRPFTGTLARPKHFQTSDSASFTDIYGGVVRAPVVASAWKGGTLALTIRNPDPNDEDTFLLTLVDATHARLELEGIPLPPIPLERSPGGQTVTTDWDRSRTYSFDDGIPSNEQMKQIFDADQRDREPGVKIDWAVVGRADDERRKAVAKLLNDGALHTGEDFQRAAFVFQHGSTPDDYLLAHTLAMVAVSRGNSAALWIGTATLDRYLQSIQQPQIYGTQYVTRGNEPTTQEPYNRTLISDALRRKLGVPPQAAQEEQRKKYDADRGIAKQ
jgi:hypothetical protein